MEELKKIREGDLKSVTDLNASLTDKVSAADNRVQQRDSRIQARHPEYRRYSIFLVDRVFNQFQTLVERTENDKGVLKKILEESDGLRHQQQQLTEDLQSRDKEILDLKNEIKRLELESKQKEDRREFFQNNPTFTLLISDF